MKPLKLRRLRQLAWLFACLAMVALTLQPRAIDDKPLFTANVTSSTLWAGDLSPERLLDINETFWANGIDGSGQSIAIIDTGIKASHQAFAGKSINWTDVTIENYTTPVDLNGTEAGHGTMCASIAAGNSSTYRGIAPGANITLVKMFYVDGGAIIAENADARAAVDRVLALSSDLNIKVASLSWGDDNASNGNDELSQIVEDLVDGGLVTVVAAGNVVLYGKPVHVAAPGSSEKVLTVGSLDQLDFDVASFSLPGPTADNRVKPDIIAPGVLIKGADHFTVDSYKISQGTSFSTPIVSGIAVLLMERYPSLDHYQLKHLLCITALECQYTNGAPDSNEGWGIVNPAGVIAAMDRSWSMTSPLVSTIVMNRSSSRSYFTRVHLNAGVTHRFTFTTGGVGTGVMDSRAEAYIYAATSSGYGVPELYTRSHGGNLLFSPGSTGDYVLAVKPLPSAWSTDGGNLAMPFCITYSEDLTIQVAWGMGIASTMVASVLAIAMAWSLRGMIGLKEDANWKKGDV